MIHKQSKVYTAPGIKYSDLAIKLSYGVCDICDIVNFVFLMYSFRCPENSTEYCKQMLQGFSFCDSGIFFKHENFSRI